MDQTSGPKAICRLHEVPAESYADIQAVKEYVHIRKLGRRLSDRRIQSTRPGQTGGIGWGGWCQDMFKPETAYSSEVGFKGLLFHRRVRLDMSVFTRDWKMRFTLSLLENSANRYW